MSYNGKRKEEFNNMLEIRPVSKYEVMLAVYMFNNAFANQTIRYNEELLKLFRSERPEKNAEILERYKNKELTIYGLYEDHIMIGTVILDGDLVRHLAVDAVHQHKGYASELMRYLMLEAKKKGIKTLKVECVGRNTPFYEKHGFKAVSDMEFTRYPHVKMEADLTKPIELEIEEPAAI